MKNKYFIFKKYLIVLLFCSVVNAETITPIFVSSTNANEVTSNTTNTTSDGTAVANTVTNTATSASNETVTVAYESSNFEKIAPLITKSLFSNVIDNSTFDMNTANSSICGDILQVKRGSGDSVATSSIINTEKTLLDFSSKTGIFTCEYKNDSVFGANQTIKKTFELEGYSKYVGAIDGTSQVNGIEIPFTSDIFSLLNGSFKPNNINKFQNGIPTNKYSVSAKAHSMGLITAKSSGISDAEDAGNYFTLSQFLSSLITLNSDVVLGTDTVGNIKIKPEVEDKMSVLSFNPYETSIYQKFITNFKLGYNFVADTVGADTVQINNDLDLENQNANTLKKTTTVDSFSSYFDKKIFGLYYNFMNIAWGNLFAYSGLIILSFLTLYTISVVGFRFALHKLDEDSKQAPFEFPIKHRLIAIGATLALSFVSFPSGEGKLVQYSNNQSETIQNQTSVAKQVISYMANAGSKIADVASSSSMVVYLEYLLNATNNQNYYDTLATINALKGEIVTQKINQTFFKDHCVSSYKSRFERVNSFQNVNSHFDSRWTSINENWEANNSSIFFSNNTESGNKGRISPLLCKKIEKRIVINRMYMEELKTIISKNISNLYSSSNDDETVNANGEYAGQSEASNMAEVFVDTQLQAVKMLGWVDIATLPLLHTFMLNSSILENSLGVERSSTGYTKGNKVTTMLKNSVKEEYKDNNNYENLEIAEESSGAENSFIERTVIELLSVQVYTLIPAFEDLRKGIKDMLNSSIDTLLSVLTKFSVFEKMPFVKDLGDKVSEITNSNGGLMALTGNSSTFVYAMSFLIAIQVFKLLLISVFSGLVTLLAVIKIVLYYVEVFIHFFISPLIVAWKLTINEKTDRIHKYIVSGFVIYLIKPTLIVFSCVMFIFSYEVMLSLYSMLFDIVFSTMEMAHNLFADSGYKSLIIMGAIRGFAEVFIHIFGIILAYFMIFKGDDMILSKFGYSEDGDSGIANQMGTKIKTLAGAKMA